MMLLLKGIFNWFTFKSRLYSHEKVDTGIGFPPQQTKKHKYKGE